MDIRRLQLWASRTATLMDNDLVRCVIEDQGGMCIEFSSVNCMGGRENCASIPHFRSMGVSVYNDENASFWKDSPTLYQMGGSYVCFPNYGPANPGKMDEEDANGYTASSYWMVERYGTDLTSGGIWVLSSVKNRQRRYVVRKLDMLLPGEHVHYTAVSVTNNGTEPLLANAAWSNNLGFPFLESGCVLNSCAKTWMTEPDHPDENVHHSFAAALQFDDLSHIPLGGGKFSDYTVVPMPNGCTDFISGRVPRQVPWGWSSVINPRQQMLELSFFPGPLTVEDGDIPMNFINYQFNYGGMHGTPYSLYDGGTSQSFSLDCGAGTNMLSLGLSAAKEKTTLMGVDTLVTINPGKTKTMYYAQAFLPYENPRMGLNFFSLEQTEGGLTLRRTKSWMFVACDPEFNAIRKLVASLNAERNGSDSGE